MRDRMARPHILAIDQGTTNTKVLMFDDAGGVVARASQPVAITFPQPGWVEQDPAALWRSVEDGLEACLAATSLTPDVVAVTPARSRPWSGSAHGRPGPLHHLAVPSNVGVLR
jgi:glycerol kinase